MNTRQLFSLTALSLLLVAGAQAQMAPPAAPSVHAATGGYLVVGVIRSVDLKTRMVTIAHQSITSMGMPAMTMPFRLDDGVSVTSVKTGDTVAFVLTSTSQGAVISSLQTVPVGGDKSAGQGKPGMKHDMPSMKMMDECREMMTQK